jgi:hypothetical protein
MYRFIYSFTIDQFIIADTNCQVSRGKYFSILY